MKKDKSCPSVIDNIMKEEPVLPRRALLAVLDDRAEPVQIFQNRPYTCVQIRSWYNNVEYLGFGFSKVMFPDKWNEEEGADIAMRRALIMILHQVRDRERGIRRMEAWQSLMDEMKNNLEPANHGE